jgi:16S rRNA (uracil1498-N3)-methyltransferase
MRVLIEQGSGERGKRVSLDADEVHHLKVRRATDGERVEVLDGAGFQGSGVLVKAGRTWMVDIGDAELQQRPPALTLAVATGDRERFSWMVEKSVELEVSRIVPLETLRTAGVATRLKAAHVTRLRRSAMEAIKQCGAAWAPTIEDPVSFGEFMAGPLNGSGWLAEQHGDSAPASVDQGSVTVIVGPEGGLTEGEREAAVSAGYRPTALGSHTLRFETAALAAAAAIIQALMRGSDG